jgi:hypothetical protein
MESKILVEASIKYEVHGDAFYCLYGCKYAKKTLNNNEFVYATCLLFGDFFRYILVPRVGRAPLRHVACIKCEQRHDSLKGDENA